MNHIWRVYLTDSYYYNTSEPVLVTCRSKRKAERLAVGYYNQFFNLKYHVRSGMTKRVGPSSFEERHTRKYHKQLGIDKPPKGFSLECKNTHILVNITKRCRVYKEVNNDSF
jgi:hypothetical protein